MGILFAVHLFVGNSEISKGFEMMYASLKKERLPILFSPLFSSHSTVLSLGFLFKQQCSDLKSQIYYA